MFLEKPTPEQVDRLIEKSGLRFFQLIEMDEETPFLKARINPEYAKATDYFCDYDSERVLIFSSEEQAITRFVVRDMEHYAHTFSKHALLRQPLSALTKFPAILEDLIWGSEGLTYSDGGVQIAASVDAKAFTKLNALLLKPFILFETAAKEDEQVYDQGQLRWVEKENRQGWEEVESRNQAFDSKEDLKKSMDYLRSYYFQLPNGKYFNYERILTEYLGQLLGKPVQNHDYRNYIEVGEQRFIFCGVMVEAKQKQELHEVESLFGFNKQPILLESKIGQGTGKTLQAAFEASLEDWLAKNRTLILELIEAES